MWESGGSGALSDMARPGLGGEELLDNRGRVLSVQKARLSADSPFYCPGRVTGSEARVPSTFCVLRTARVESAQIYQLREGLGAPLPQDP
jgi:hypothetical protein